VTDRVSIADAAERIRQEFGRLDLLVQNAVISNTRKGSFSEWVPRSWPELTLQRGEGVGLHSAA
jgi:NAD(P)-dependent dehydrogenase (short-subunit alcohol dehydrogenase family)